MSDSQAAWATFVDAFHEHFTRDANRCVFIGVDKNTDRLPDPSAAAQDLQVAEGRELLVQLDGIDPGGLQFADQLDLDLARLSLQAEIHDATYTFNGAITAEQQPRAGDAVGDGLFTLFINDPRPADVRLSDMTSRLEQVPEYLAAAADRLGTPVQRWVDIELEKIGELPDMLTVLQGWCAEVGWADGKRMGKACEAAELAMKAYAARVAALPTTTQLHVGDGVARELVSLRGIDKPLEEIHRSATSFLAETNDTIASLRSTLVARHGLAADTSTAELQRWLGAKFRVELPGGKVEEVLDVYTAERDKILRFITERDLFPVPEDQEMKIIRTPSFMAPSIPAGAMMPPPAFRDGTRTSLVYLTLSEALRDEHTRLTIPVMMIHEGIPGHHLQLATAAMHPSVVRRHFDALEHAEGWTTMLEDYMLDQGYMGDLTDEARFCGKRDIARIGARVAIDLFFMTGERGYLDVGIDCDLSDPDPFVAAGNLLAEVTGFVPERVQAELNWYSQERGYPLSYLTGNRLVWELKGDIAAAKADQMTQHQIDRRFHEVYLTSGNMPVRFLRRVCEHEGLLS